MTLNRLCKILNALRPEHGHCRVSVDKRSFRDARESDGCTILMIHGADVRWINDMDDDGGLAVNKDGSERGRRTVILFGGSYERG